MKKYLWILGIFQTIKQIGGSPKSDYGGVIQEEVLNFSNLYSPKDNVLEPYPAPIFGIYPSFEGDQALGQSGNQTSLTVITTPENYTDVNVESEIPENSGVNITDADGDGECDFGLRNFTTGVCHADVGDNHAGYIGFRDPNNNSSLTDDGAIDVVVGDWTATP